MSQVLNAMFSDKPGGGDAMTKDEKKAAHKDAMAARKNLNLSAVALCKAGSKCDGTTNQQAGDATVTKKQFIKKTQAAGTIDLTDGDAKFSFPNVKTDVPVYVS